MAWPNNNFNSFWEAISGPNGPPHHPPHGAGVDHAPPPPPELPPFMNPDFWNRWSQRPGWENFAGPSEGPWGHGPHGRHAHAHGRRRGGRGGRHGRNSGEDEAERGASVHDITDDEAFPPEYISDEEVAAATAAAEAEKKTGASGGEKDGSPDTMMQDDTADPPEEIPSPEEASRPRHGGRHGRRGGRGGFGREGFAGHQHRRGGPRGAHHHGGPSAFGFGGFGGESRRRSRGPHGHHHGPPPPPPFFEGFFGPQRGPHGPHGHHHRGPPPPPPFGGAFDLRGVMAALANHPAAQQVREYIERMQRGTMNNDGNRAMTPSSSDDEDGMGASFSPPLDLFELPDRWVLHLAVPGAKKEDVGVNWDGDRSMLGISGVVYRPGDEQFLQGLVSGERSVGLFSREVRLPPAEKETKEEVNSDGIEAKMEEGVLVITVPKVEKDWTEVKRVEIQ